LLIKKLIKTIFKKKIMRIMMKISGVLPISTTKIRKKAIIDRCNLTMNYSKRIRRR